MYDNVFGFGRSWNNDAIKGGPSLVAAAKPTPPRPDRPQDSDLATRVPPNFPSIENRIPDNFPVPNFPNPSVSNSNVLNSNVPNSSATIGIDWSSARVLNAKQKDQLPDRFSQSRIGLNPAQSNVGVCLDVQGNLVLYDREEDKVLATGGGRSMFAARQLKFAPDGGSLFVGGPFRSAIVTLNQNKFVERQVAGRGTAALLPDECVLYAERQLLMFQSKSESKQLLETDWSIDSIFVSNNGRFAVALSRSTVHVVDLKNNHSTEHKFDKFGFQRFAWCTAKGQRAFVIGSSELHLLDLQTGKQEKIPLGLRLRLSDNDFAVNSDGAKIAISVGNSVYIYDVNEKRCEARINCAAKVESAIFTSDATAILVVDADKAVAEYPFPGE
jgi:hypothetical protein